MTSSFLSTSSKLELVILIHCDSSHPPDAMLINASYFPFIKLKYASNRCGIYEKNSSKTSYGSSTVRQILKCSHYKRTLSTHIHIYMALYELTISFNLIKHHQFLNSKLRFLKPSGMSLHCAALYSNFQKISSFRLSLASSSFIAISYSAISKLMLGIKF